jgi:hypothetical protein
MFVFIERETKCIHIVLERETHTNTDSPGS